jgi:uncharacterized membrane protein
MTRSGLLILLIIAIVAMIALMAYSRMHPADLPNFHW